MALFAIARLERIRCFPQVPGGSELAAKLRRDLGRAEVGRRRRGRPFGILAGRDTVTVTRRGRRTRIDRSVGRWISRFPPGPKLVFGCSRGVPLRCSARWRTRASLRGAGGLAFAWGVGVSWTR